MNTQPLTCGTRVSADPTRQRDENRGGARDYAAAVELTNDVRTQMNDLMQQL